MPISFDVESVAGIAIGTGTGSLSLEEVKLAATMIWERMSGPTYRILWDLLDAQFSLTASEVRDLAYYVTNHAPEGESHTAFVVSGDLEFGLVRMFEVFRGADGARTYVTRDRAAAIEWLNDGADRK
jgi:hypothetical protein